MRSLILFICAPLILTGCSKSSSEARSADEFRMSLQTSQELAEVDADLDSLTAETENLKKSYRELQSSVLPHVTLESDEPEATRLTVFINENNVLIVNDTPMSRNQFIQYIDKNLPALCTPVPSLSIHSKAIYDSAAWVLDSIYSHGCSDVSIE